VTDWAHRVRAQYGPPFEFARYLRYGRTRTVESLPSTRGVCGTAAGGTAEFTKKIARYQQALDEGASPTVVMAWIAQAEHQRDAALATTRHAAVTAKWFVRSR